MNEFDIHEEDGKIAYEEGLKLLHYCCSWPSIPYFQKSAELNYPPALLRICAIYQQNEAKYKYWADKCAIYKDWFFEQAKIFENSTTKFLVGLYLDIIENQLSSAFMWYQKSALDGLAEAQNAVGLCYFKGRGTIKDYSQALLWFHKAAQQQFPDSMFQISICYYQGCGVPQDMCASCDWNMKACELGHAQAMNSAGFFYERDQEGIQKDWSKAFSWYQKSAELGCEWGLFSLARCYEEGIHVPKDDPMTVELTMKAASQGFGRACRKLAWWSYSGTKLPHNLEQFKFWLEKGAEEGHPISMHELAMYCYCEEHGVEKNIEKTLYWLNKAAQMENAFSQNQLAEWFEQGKNVPQNFRKAFEFYKCASESELWTSWIPLGKMYYFGKGVEQNYHKAIYWFEKANQKDLAESKYYLALCYHYGDGVEQDCCKALELLSASKNAHAEELKKMYAPTSCNKEEPQTTNQSSNINNVQNRTPSTSMSLYPEEQATDCYLNHNIEGCGGRCGNRHVSSELKRKPVCIWWKEGNCSDYRCSYRHPSDQWRTKKIWLAKFCETHPCVPSQNCRNCLPERPDRRRQQLSTTAWCRNYPNCHFGDKCWYKHPTSNHHGCFLAQVILAKDLETLSVVCDKFNRWELTSQMQHFNLDRATKYSRHNKKIQASNLFVELRTLWRHTNEIQPVYGLLKAVVPLMFQKGIDSVFDFCETLIETCLKNLDTEEVALHFLDHVIVMMLSWSEQNYPKSPAESQQKVFEATSHYLAQNVRFAFSLFRYALTLGNFGEIMKAKGFTGKTMLYCGVDFQKTGC